jgi:hypothetical protein
MPLQEAILLQVLDRYREMYMNTLYFEKISCFDRQAEPVTVSIPFAPGKLADPRALVVRDGDVVLPAQRRVLATWPNGVHPAGGGIKWLLVHLQPDLPGNADKTLYFEVADNVPEVEPHGVVKVTETPDGIAVDTGPLSFLVPKAGFLPIRDVQLDGVHLWGEAPFTGFTLRCDGQEVSSASGAVELEIEEAGPLRAVILIKGKHRQPDGTAYLDLRGRVTAHAGKSYIEVEHQFIHAEEEVELSLEAIEFAFAPQGGESPHLALGQGYYRTAVEESDGDSLEMVLDAETLLYQSNEHFVDSFYGDFWVDWRAEDAGLTLSIHQAHQSFPKKLRVARDGIACSLYPVDVPPAPLLQGMAKTHRIQLHFHSAETPLQECSVRSLQFQLPDRPALPRAWFRENNPWLEDFFPAQLPNRLITYTNKLHDSRPAAVGMFHFGDAPDAGYTNQGRGRGHTVWVNNEYDRPHACTLYYGLTGQRRALDSALVTARHWLDVDLCHYSPDPLVDGGLKAHTRYHVIGKATPSHEWVEGFLDYYFLTGRREAMEAARSVAENILRHMARPELSTPGAASVREGGWALRAMVGMWIGTGEERWKAEARRLAKMYLDWYDEYGALLAPYTSHTMPRVTFMISLTVNSFARYLLIEDDPDLVARVERLIVENVDDLLTHCLGPDGIAYYKELPSLRRSAATFHLLEALTHAYRITGSEEYLKVATRHFAAMDFDIDVQRCPKYLDDSGAVIANEGRGRFFADRYTSLVLYAGIAMPLGLLDWYEYPY